MIDSEHNVQARDVLIALRRIMQAVDSHSRRLMQGTGLSVPQILVLQALAASEAPIGTGALAQQLNLTQGTVSAILERLERKALIARARAGTDRRRVQITLTAVGRETLDAAPPLLQDHFLQRFGELPGDDRSQILASLQRVATLMRADDLDVPPLLDPLTNPIKE